MERLKAAKSSMPLWVIASLLLVGLAGCRQVVNGSIVGTITDTSLAPGGAKH